MRFKTIFLLIVVAVTTTLNVSAYDKQKFLNHVNAIPILKGQLSDQQIDEIIAQEDDAVNDYLLTKVAENMLVEYPVIKDNYKLNLGKVDDLILYKDRKYSYNTTKYGDGPKFEAAYNFALPFLNYLNIDPYFKDAVEWEEMHYPTKIYWGKGLDYSIFSNSSFKKVFENSIKNYKKDPQTSISNVKAALNVLIHDITPYFDLNEIKLGNYGFVSFREPKGYDDIYALQFSDGQRQTEVFLFSKKNGNLVRTVGDLDLPMSFDIKNPNGYQSSISLGLNKEEPSSRMYSQSNAHLTSYNAYMDTYLNIKVKIVMDSTVVDKILLYNLGKDAQNLNNWIKKKPIIKMFMSFNGLNPEYKDLIKIYNSREDLYAMKNCKFYGILPNGEIEEAWWDNGITFPYYETEIIARNQKKIAKDEAEKQKEKKENDQKLIKRLNDGNLVGLYLNHLVRLEELGALEVDGYDANMSSNQTGGYFTIINKKTKARIRVRMNGFGEIVGQCKL